MASTSRSLFLLSLLVSSFGMTVTASRSLEETNKLSPGDLDKFVHSKGGLIDLVLTVDLSELLLPVELLLENAVGDLVKLKVVQGLVTQLNVPIQVKVSVDGTVIIVVKALGKTVSVPLKLSELNPVETVGGVLRVVVKLVGGLNVVQLVSPLTGEVFEIISALGL